MAIGAGFYTSPTLKCRKIVFSHDLSSRLLNHQCIAPPSALIQSLSRRGNVQAQMHDRAAALGYCGFGHGFHRRKSESKLESAVFLRCAKIGVGKCSTSYLHEPQGTHDEDRWLGGFRLVESSWSALAPCGVVYWYIDCIAVSMGKLRVYLPILTIEMRK